MVQWLGRYAFTAGAPVQSLVGKLRSCKPHGAAKIIIIIISEKMKYSTQSSVSHIFEIWASHSPRITLSSLLKNHI